MKHRFIIGSFLVVLWLSVSCAHQRYESTEAACKKETYNEYECARHGAYALELGFKEKGEEILRPMCFRENKGYACKWFKELHTERYNVIKKYFGCASVYDDSMDHFIYIETDDVCKKSGFGEVQAFPRVIVNRKNMKLSYYIYVYTHRRDWVFLETARFLYKGKLTPTIEMTQVDREVVSGSGVIEEYTFPITKPMFEHFTNNPMELKLIGSRGNKKLTVGSESFRDLKRISEDVRQSKLKYVH